MELRPQSRGYGDSEIDRSDAERRCNQHGSDTSRGHRPAAGRRPGRGPAGRTAETERHTDERLDGLEGEPERQGGAETDARPVQGERGRTGTGAEVPGSQG